MSTAVCRRTGVDVDRDLPARQVHVAGDAEDRHAAVHDPVVQWLPDVLPAFEGQPDRYVLWAEGSTDEMCLGTLTVAFDDEQ